MARVSIAMATYNGARWLQAQLDSFAHQTRRPDELVVTDDGSTDGTADMVAAFASVAPFDVRFVSNPERLGFNGNFAHAIGLTTGDIVFISDQDDVWYPDKIERVLRQFADEPECLCIVNDQAIADGDGRETGGTVLANVRALGRPDSWYGPGCCTAFAKALLAVAQPLPGNAVAYDHWINSLADAMGRRRILPVALQSYRRHGANASGSVFAMEQAGRGQLVRAAWRTDSKAAIAAKVVELDTLLRRLAGDTAARLAAPGALPRALVEMEAERSDYIARREALALPRATRVTRVAKLFLAGSYRRFSGFATAMKDVMS